ncbi:MAG: hydrogenase small subunit, partial [Magnetococcales bacterium]|nr:hydrogenase small subunit [Magnetococcales bacterium]
GLGEMAIPRMAEALEELSLGTTPVLWLQAQACSGCSVSLLNTDEPGPAELLTQYITLLYHSTISTATGEVAMKVVNGSIQKGGYILVVEGAIPAKMESACVMDHKPMGPLIVKAAQQAKAVITVGTCSSWGGIPAAENNPTGAMSVVDYLKEKGVDKPVIRLPGCPTHPDWVVGTIAHVVGFGMPPLDKKGRPLMFYEKTVHEQCPRFSDFERERFARTFTEPGCLFELGCVGPRSFADCSQRLWNNRTNFCIRAGAPCIGCAMEDFAKSADFAMFPKGKDMMRRRQQMLPEGKTS